MTSSSHRSCCLLLLTIGDVQVSAEVLDWVHVGVLAAPLAFFGFLVFYQDPLLSVVGDAAMEESCSSKLLPFQNDGGR